MIVYVVSADGDGVNQVEVFLDPNMLALVQQKNPGMWCEMIEFIDDFVNCDDA